MQEQGRQQQQPTACRLAALPVHLPPPCRHRAPPPHTSTWGPELRQSGAVVTVLHLPNCDPITSAGVFRPCRAAPACPCGRSRLCRPRHPSLPSGSLASYLPWECLKLKLGRLIQPGLLLPCFPPPSVISDYVPRGIQVPVRAGVVGLSLLTAVGLTKLALGGERVLWGCLHGHRACSWHA